MVGHRILFVAVSIVTLTGCTAEQINVGLPRSDHCCNPATVTPALMTSRAPPTETT